MVVRKGRGSGRAAAVPGRKMTEVVIGYVVKARFPVKAWRTIKGERVEIDALKTKVISERFMSMSAAQTYAEMARKAHPEYESVWPTEEYGWDDI